MQRSHTKNSRCNHRVSLREQQEQFVVDRRRDTKPMQEQEYRPFTDVDVRDRSPFDKDMHHKSYRAEFINQTD